MGAWIEIPPVLHTALGSSIVAPYMGAWIEMHNAAFKVQILYESHPTWVRGLKCMRRLLRQLSYLSHPTWVRGLKFEILEYILCMFRRTLHGCVD